MRGRTRQCFLKWFKYKILLKTILNFFRFVWFVILNQSLGVWRLLTNYFRRLHKINGYSIPDVFKLRVWIEIESAWATPSLQFPLHFDGEKVMISRHQESRNLHEWSWVEDWKKILCQKTKTNTITNIFFQSSTLGQKDYESWRLMESK